MAKTDWRKRPRKPPELLRSEKVLIRLTASEIEQFRARAATARLTLVDWIVTRCLGKNAR